MASTTGMPPKRVRMASTAATSQPGLILILMRRYPASSSLATLAARSSSESWMPIDTPDAISERVPPSRRASGASCKRAARSQAAISTAAFAMWWPRTRASDGKTSRGCA
jgi:hypothetical protein